MVVDIHVLGEQGVAGGDHPVSLAPRTLALLTYLVLHSGSATPRMYLAALFWPDSDEAQARTNLRRELYKLRSFLPDTQCIAANRTNVGWQDSPVCRIDVRVFRQEASAALAAREAADHTGFLGHAELAMEAYRGDLLPGNYEDWVLEQRTELRTDCARLCEAAVRGWLDAGEVARALGPARRAIQLEPLAETGYRLLMETQAALGDSAAVMNTYHRCAAVLERELGVEPDAATSRLRERLLHRSGPGVSGAGGASSARPPEGEAILSFEGQWPRGAKPALIGRGPELAALLRHWHEAARGMSRIVLVSGESGLGKSRLAEELVAQVRRLNGAVATARCFASSGRVGLAPVAEWLRQEDLMRGSWTLDPLWQFEVRRLVPDFGGSADVGLYGGAALAGDSRRRATAAGSKSGTPARTGPEPSGGPASLETHTPAGQPAMIDPWQRHRFFEGLARSVAAVPAPTLLVIDDVQWCDAETIAWIDFLTGFAPDARLLIVLAARPGELADNSAVSRQLRAMKSSGALTELTLKPLGAAGSIELAEAVGRRPLTAAEAELLNTASGGYPLYLVEAARLLRDAAAPGRRPDISDLDEVLEHRLGQLSPTARSTASLAGSVGQDFTLDLLCAASELDPAVLVTAVDELWNRRILRTKGAGGYDFTHDAFRQAAYRRASPAQRWLHHRQLAQALEVLYAGRQTEVAAQLAEQYSRAGQSGPALDYFMMAGKQAAAVFAETEALVHYGRCLQLIEQLPAGPDRDDKELQIHELRSARLVSVQGYSSPQLKLSIERAEELAQRLHRPETVLASLIGQFAVRFVRGETALAYRTGQRALELAKSSPQFLGQAHFAIGGPALSLGRPTEAIRHFKLALDHGTGIVPYILGTVVEAHALDWAAHAYWLTGQDATALSVSAEADERGRESGHPFTLAVTLAYAAVLQQFRGDTRTLAAILPELGELCQRYGTAYYTQCWRILDGWLVGGPDGIARIEAGIEKLRSQHSFARMPYWLSLLAGTMISTGQVGPARAVLDAAGAAAADHDDRWWLPEVHRLRASLEYDDDVRIALLRRAERLAAEQDSTALQLRCQADLATAMMQQAGPTAPPPFPPRGTYRNGTGTQAF